MFRAIAHDFDPRYWTRWSTAVLLLSSVGGALGTAWLVFELLSRISWFLLQMLYAWLLPPAFAVAMLPVEPVTYELVERVESARVRQTVVALELDEGLVEVDLGAFEPDPVFDPADLPPLPSERLERRRAIAAEIESSGLLLKLIGTTGSSDGSVSDLFASRVGIGSLDSALADMDGVAVLGTTGTGIGGGGGSAEIGDLGNLAGLDAALTTIAPTRDVVDAAIRDRMRFFQRCFQRELAKDPELAGGKVVLAFGVTPSGSVRDARVASSTLEHSAVERCLVGEVQKLRLEPSPAGIDTITFPFIFRVQ